MSAAVRPLLGALVAVLGALVAVACADAEATREPAAALPSVPAALARGESLFVASCARCHGVEAAGTTTGPPLAHVIYEPSHHGDASFRLAVLNGVRAHHWSFGDMPPQPGVSEAAVDEIVAYVRWVQRERGIE